MGLWCFLNGHEASILLDARFVALFTASKLVAWLIWNFLNLDIEVSYYKGGCGGWVLELFFPTFKRMWIFRHFELSGSRYGAEASKFKAIWEAAVFRAEKGKQILLICRQLWRRKLSICHDSWLIFFPQKNDAASPKNNKTNHIRRGRYIGPCHVSGIPLQKGFFPFCKGEKPRCLAGAWMRLSLEGKKIPAHMTRASVMWIFVRLSNKIRPSENKGFWCHLVSVSCARDRLSQIS
jgi:hypothetical protein